MSMNPASGRLMNRFAAYALGAVKAEREGSYLVAADLWLKASSAPCGATNKSWANERNAFCNHAASRGWSNPNASQRA